MDTMLFFIDVKVVQGNPGPVDPQSPAENDSCYMYLEKSVICILVFLAQLPCGKVNMTLTLGVVFV